MFRVFPNFSWRNWANWGGRGGGRGVGRGNWRDWFSCGGRGTRKRSGICKQHQRWSTIAGQWVSIHTTSRRWSDDVLAMRPIQTVKVSTDSVCVSRIHRLIDAMPFRRCKARVRIKADGTKVEIAERHHNHGMLTERRKKGVLKALYSEKKKFQSAQLTEQIWMRLWEEQTMNYNRLWDEQIMNYTPYTRIVIVSF